MQLLHRLEDRRDFLERCSRCSQCKFVSAPQSQRHASACPSIDYGQWHAHSASGQIIMGYGLLDGIVSASPAMLAAVSSCTMCGHCDVACKTNFGETVEPLDSLYALRAKLAESGQSPAAYRTLMDHLRAQGNSAGAPKAGRGRWAEGMTSVASGHAADVLLHVGSTLAYDESRWPALRSVVQALQRAGVAVQHLGADEGSSGSTAFDLGFVDEARAFAQQMAEAVRRSKASTLVTFSAPALAAFRTIYPRLGVDFGSTRMLHFSEYLLELVQAGRLKLARPASAGTAAVAFHDPCKLGRLSEPWQPHDMALDLEMNGVYVSRDPAALRFGNDGCYEPPRALLRAMGLHVAELARNRSSSFCCGACGGVKEAEPEAAALAARSRLSELEDSGAGVMVSGCTGCTRHMGAHAHANSQGPVVVDLLEMVAQALAASSAPAPSPAAVIG